MIPAQSKILLAFGNPTQPRIQIPSGVEIILYDQIQSTVLVQYTDDIIGKLSANADLMARTPALLFQGIPIFNRDLTLPSDIYQRVFVAGTSVPDFLLKPTSTFGPFEKKISGFYTPGPASIVFTSEYVAVVNGMDTILSAKIQSASRFSDILNVLATLPSSSRTVVRCYAMMVGY
jgi:hypothetical protein